MTVNINVGANRRSISPYIYGVAFGTQTALDELNAPLNRNGGNASSRYNWQLNASNRGNDWYFESLPYSSPDPGGEVDAFITRTRAAGAEPIITLPMVGWVARLGANRTRMCSFSIATYGSQTDRDWQWYPDAGNGVLTDGRYVTNDPNDANQTADPAFQQGWVSHLLARWGTASSGGVRYYLMDNEPSLWHSTHRDVHPTGATMDEVRDKHLAYAGMVKTTDPAALVFGPEEWGWSGYFYSGYDHQYAPQSGWSRFPDRENHGGWDYVPWLLDQFRQHEQTTGRRLLDVLSVHYYPQGGEFGSDTSTSMQLRRNRSTRSLWDPAYVDESWIQDEVMLIPRLKSWVGTYYPGTKVGITEYNWGAEAHINGAIAQADILGIFGREGLDYGVRWEAPAPSTPTYKAMKLYRNHDGLKSSFGNVSVSCAVPNPDNLSAFAAERTSDGALTVMVLSKVLSGDTPVTLNLGGFAHAGVVRRWQLTAANTINRLADITFSGSGMSSTVPAQSITLFVIPAGGTGPTNQPPLANATATPTSGTAPLVVSLDGSGSADPDGNLVSYVWNFGDGQQGTGPMVSHSYSLPGTYTATLTVTDDDGATASSTVTISVLSASSTLTAPSNFYAQASGSNVTLRWTDNSQGEEGFIIERSPEVYPFDFREVGRVGANVTVFVNSQVPQGSYYYRVRAYQGTSFSGYSNMDGARVR